MLGDIVRVYERSADRRRLALPGNAGDGHGNHQFAGISRRSPSAPRPTPRSSRTDREGLRRAGAELYVSENLRAPARRRHTEDANATTNTTPTRTYATQHVSNTQGTATNVTQTSAANVVRLRTGGHDPLLGRRPLTSWRWRGAASTSRRARASSTARAQATGLRR